MSFVLLVLGHLLGDFTFQTDAIAENKAKSWKWNLLHSAIVTVCMLPFAALSGLRVVAAVILNGAIHYFIDWYKARLPVRSSVQELAYFIGDQTLHIGLIYIIYVISRKAAVPALAIEQEQILFVFLLIAVASFGGILNQYVLRMVFPGEMDSFFLKNEKLVGSIARVTVFIVLLLSHVLSYVLFLLIPVLIALKILYYYGHWNRWLKKNYFFTRFAIDMVIAGVGCSVLLILI